MLLGFPPGGYDVGTTPLMMHFNIRHLVLSLGSAQTLAKSINQKQIKQALLTVSLH